ncbi:sugar ABC transporter ATP-binding protein [Mycolicibacterium smegmatis]|uniref:Ribose transport ATP-binding protein RbsA n=1 Tax=Mycolicibacterium smegmatis (strain MKD8) TaxID=1214915 RepID=A0A2U9PI85_MYCSE|nr:sugar ABC transporter ATP-binding protein [Mycolicibacterium smegmatis]AWT51457.1 ribose transport ATP-binding protein RbsA [Mycolicibacterium smegmatis MKD8]
MTSRLAISGLTKRYPGVVALDDVTLEIRPNEVVGIIGQNGAGKSTLLKVLAGAIQPDSGRIELNGKAATLRNAADAASKGIGIVYQEQSLVENLTVAENIFVGRKATAMAGGVYRWTKLYDQAQVHLDDLGAAISPSAIVERLTFAEKQMVELAKLLALESQVDGPLTVLLDEPTSVLSGAEIERLFVLIRRLKQRSSVLFVSHRMDEVLSISDRVYVMSDGKCIAERRAEECDEDELYRLMVGEAHAKPSRRPSVVQQDVRRLAVHVPAVPGKLATIDFEVMAGEVLGFAGVLGSGRDVLCRALFGLEKKIRPTVTVDGKEVRIRSPKDAIHHGIGLLPAERKVEGVVLGRSILENATYCTLDRHSRPGGWIGRSEREAVNTWVDRLKIKLSSVDDDIDSLSGGNQQKVALAKWLAIPDLKVLILDHPTRGLDLKAKADVYEIIRGAAKGGLSIVLLSDTLDELFSLSDRVIVMKDGRISGAHDDAGQNPDFEQVVKEMV